MSVTMAPNEEASTAAAVAVEAPRRLRPSAENMTETTPYMEYVVINP